jgi:type IV pilus assembly protein PilA
VKLFCSKCGQAKEVEDSARGATVTCAGCGNRFSVGGQAPGSSNSTKLILIIVAAVAAVPVVVAIIGILAAIAIPNFIRFQARSKQSECKTNLKAFATASRSYFYEHDQYTPVLSDLGFKPERGNRYAYFAGPGTQEDRSKAVATGAPGDTQIGMDLFRYAGSKPITMRDVPATLAGGVVPGVSGTCPDCTIVAVCAGTVDNDATLDVWSVSMTDRHGPHGEAIPPGIPFNDINDVSE